MNLNYHTLKIRSILINNSNLMYSVVENSVDKTDNKEIPPIQ